MKHYFICLLYILIFFICNGVVFEVKKKRQLKTKPPENVSPDCIRDTKIMVERLYALRQAIENHGLNAYMLLWTDQHQSDYLLPPDEAIEYLTGYERAAVMVVVTQKSASLYIEQVLPNIKNNYGSLTCTYQVAWIPPAWEHRSEDHLFIKYGDPLIQLTNVNRKGDVVTNKIGFYSKNVPIKVYKIWEKILSEQVTTENKNVLKPFAKDLVRNIWEKDLGINERPTQPNSAVYVHKLQYAGLSRKQKLLKVQQKLKDKNFEYFFTLELDEIAWMFNLRGYDYLLDSLFKSYALISRDAAWLFVENDMEQETLAELQADGLIIKPRSYVEVLKVLAKNGNKGVLFTTDETSYHHYQKFVHVLTLRQIVVGQSSFVRGMMIKKTKTEIQGMKKANIRFSIIMLEIIAALNAMVHNHSEVTEFNIYRNTEIAVRDTELIAGPCKEIYSAFHSHTIIPNYSPSEIGSPVITPIGLFRLSAGFHFQDGTASFSRTFQFGRPGSYTKEIYTTILAGLIDIARHKFPETTTDNDLEMILLAPLYKLSLTTFGPSGHGVGMFLRFKEKFILVNRHSADQIFTKLKPGHIILMNPTVLYRHDAGISLEIIFRVVRSPLSKLYYPENFYQFKPLTFFPFQSSMINESLLSHLQRKWLNNYHKLTYKQIVKKQSDQKLSKLALEWLKEETLKNPLKECIASHFRNQDELMLLVWLCVGITLTQQQRCLL